MGLAGITSRARLPDGRMIGYAEYGDPAAPPVIYCHGWPTSRLEAGLGPNLKLRLIAADRPGYGLGRGVVAPHGVNGNAHTAAQSAWTVST